MSYSNYPDGAANDPRAPYNQVELTEVYETQIHAAVDEEMAETDGEFAEWLMSNGYIPDDEKVKPETLEQLISTLASDGKVYEDYYEYRAEDLANEFAEQYASERDIDPSDYDE